MEFDPGFHKDVAKTMEYRLLGKTDMMVSKISLGGASFGINCLFSYHENLLESIDYLNFWFHKIYMKYPYICTGFSFWDRLRKLHKFTWIVLSVHSSIHLVWRLFSTLLKLEISTLLKLQTRWIELISWTNWVNSGKFVDNCWISCQVMADMKQVYDDLIIINLYEYHKCRILLTWSNNQFETTTTNPNFRHSSFDRTKGSNKGHEIFESIIQHEF